MSKFRTLADQYKKHGIPPIIRNAQGQILCRYCSTIVKSPRRVFCSAECAYEYNIRIDTNFARQEVKKRDKGICQICKRDCIKLQRELQYLSIEERIIIAEELGFPLFRVKSKKCKSLWDMDHATPVVLGGGSCGLDNLRTLCCVCHAVETFELKQELKNKKQENKKKTITRMKKNLNM